VLLHRIITIQLGVFNTCGHPGRRGRLPCLGASLGHFLALHVLDPSWIDPVSSCVLAQAGNGVRLLDQHHTPQVMQEGVPKGGGPKVARQACADGVCDAEEHQ